MRKILSVMLALVLMLSTVGAFAADNHEVPFAKDVIGAPRTDLKMEDYIDTWIAIGLDEQMLGTPEANGISFAMEIDGEKAVVTMNDGNGETSFESPVVLTEEGCITIEDANGETLAFHLYDSENLVQIVEEGTPRFFLQRGWLAELIFALMAETAEMTDEERAALEEAAKELEEVADAMEAITEEDIEEIAAGIEGIFEIFDAISELTEEDLDRIEAALDSITEEDIEEFADDLIEYVETLSEEEQAEFEEGLEVLADIFSIFQ